MSFELRAIEFKSQGGSD